MKRKERTQLRQEFLETPEDGLVDTSQVAAFLNCSTAKLERDRWMGEGLPFVKLGRLVRYRKQTVLDHISAAYRTSTTTVDGPQ